ncbi:hypothetical protein GT354_08195 [Streptomyces sp. SID3343]|nr:hypothetical protein [Streptomyces sp. SID3343]MYV98260.1 hypothetical protein [Streptomyces sp. SID3343]
MGSHAARFEIEIFPFNDQDVAVEARGPAVRSAVVHLTGETGASGYPRYAGDGVTADIDPHSHAIEALTIDGAELENGWTARVGGAQEPTDS